MMTSGTRRLAGAFVATTLLAACGGGGDSGGGGNSGDGGTVRQALDSIPAAALVAAEADDNVQVEIADLSAVAALGSLDAPAPGRDPDAVGRWMFALEDLRTDPAAVDVVLSPLLIRAAGRDAFGDVDEILGLDSGAVTSFAVLSSGLVDFATYVGDGSPAESLVDVGDGVASTYDADDGKVDVDNVSVVSPIGFPVRVAVADDAMSVSSRRDLVAAWAAGGASLGDDADFAAVAGALDARQVVSAVLIRNDFGVDNLFSLPPEVDSAVTIDAPFGLVGVGAATIDDAARLVAVYLFADDGQAAAAVDPLRSTWTTDTAIVERAELEVIESSGRTVTVIAAPQSTGPLRTGYDFLVRAQSVFLHR